MKKTLIIVDAQNDFISGSLACEGAVSKMHELAYFIETKGNDYETIILTLDWHPKNHMSFIKNGGEWPEHCVQYSSGSAIYQPILDKLPKDKQILFLIKGTNANCEEYSIMQNAESSEVIKSILDINQGDIDICGIANEFCVKNTVADLVNMGYGNRIKLLSEFIVAVADNTVLFSYAKENNLKVS